jgi:DNA anti-recombination protein RmuC
MSFTEDELQAFHAVLEERFAAHRQEMEQALDQRLNTFRQDIDQQFTALQRELSGSLRQISGEQQAKSAEELTTTFQGQQEQIARIVSQEADQKAQQVEATVDRMLAAQLLGIEQLLNQQVTRRNEESSAFAQGMPPQLEAIEVQTDLAWDDLAAMVGKTLDERLATLGDSLQRSVKNLEQYLAVRLHSLSDEVTRGLTSNQSYNGQVSNGPVVQEMLAGIEHLERIMESMQVAMTANHALLSNRLYHHQQLPLERAHPVSHAQVTPVHGDASLLAEAKERIASGQDLEKAARQRVDEKTQGQ